MLQRIAIHLAHTQPRSAAAATTPLVAEDAIPEAITEAQRLPLSDDARRLTSAEIAQFREDGYVTGLPLFADAAVPHLQAKALEMFEQLAHEAPDIRVDKVWTAARFPQRTFSRAVDAGGCYVQWMTDAAGS